MIQEKKLKVEDCEIFYLQKVAVNPKIVIVFIHGFPFSSAMWQAQLLALPETVEAFAFDIRGFGKSTTPHTFFSVDLFARDLFSFLDALNIDEVILCGLSMGGYISLRAAQINKERISGLILCDTNCVADPEDSKLKRFAAIDLVISGKKKEFAADFLKNLFAEESFNRNLQAINFIQNIILNTADATLCGALLALASRTDTSSVLAELDMPALVIRGEHDKVMTPEQAVQLQQGLKGAELLIVPQSGHMSNLENPEVFNSSLLSFLHKHFL